jgi:hypothetical protein
VKEQAVSQQDYDHAVQANSAAKAQMQGGLDSMGAAQ